MSYAFSVHLKTNIILHALDKYSLKYDNSLKEQIEVRTDIESIKKKVKERLWYWKMEIGHYVGRHYVVKLLTVGYLDGRQEVVKLLTVGYLDGGQ